MTAVRFLIFFVPGKTYSNYHRYIFQVMKSIIFLSLLILWGNVFSQRSLIGILSQSEQAPNWIGYVDNKGVFYSCEKANGVQPKITFSKVEYISSTNMYLIEGRVIVDLSNGSEKIIGYCCFDVFLGNLRGDSILNIKKLGSTSFEDSTIGTRNGDFSFMTELSYSQRIFFATSYGQGLREFTLDHLINSSTRLSQKEYF